MTRRMKGVLMAAAMLAAGAARADGSCGNGALTWRPGTNQLVCDAGGSGRMVDLTLLNASMDLSFSNGGIGTNGLLVNGDVPTTVGGLVGALNAVKVDLSPLDGAQLVQPAIELVRVARGYVNINAPVTALETASATGDVQSINTSGGFEALGSRLPEVLNGGRLGVRNLRIDVANKAVYADMSGQALNEDGSFAPLESLPGLKLWTIGAISGPVPPTAAGLLAGADGDLSALQGLGYTLVQQSDGYVAKTHIEMTDLRVTDEGLAYFAKSLGMSSPDIGYTVLAGVNAKPGGWGSIGVNIVFGMVPEPSTYALMGLGLVGIALTAHRRSFQAQALPASVGNWPPTGPIPILGE